MALVTIREAYRNITKGNTDVCACMNGKFHVCTVNTRENKAICLIMAFKTVHIHSQNTFKPPPPQLSNQYYSEHFLLAHLASPLPQLIPH